MPEGPSSADNTPDAPLSITFTDASGASWAVWEVTPGPLPPRLRHLLGGDAPPGGALLFVSETGEWRVLVPAPPDWSSFGADKLEACLARARPVGG